MKNDIPPSSNTGVTTFSKNPLQPFNHGAYSDLPKKQKMTEKLVEVEFNKPKYDWFAGNVKGVVYGEINGKPNYLKIDPEEYLNDVLMLFSEHGIPYDEVHDTRIQGRYINKKALFVCKGYQHAYHLRKDGESILSISYGGYNGAKSLYVSSTGASCNEVFKKIKTLPYNLFSSRVDACYDSQQDFKSLKSRLIRYCKNHKLSYRVDGKGCDKNGERTGETLYIDLTACKRIRVYEKGYERRAENPESNAPLDWIRFEIETRGDIANTDQGKLILTQATPEELLTVDVHSTALFNKFSGGKKEPSMLRFTVKKTTDLEMSKKHMIIQYRKALEHSTKTPEDFLNLMIELYGDLESDELPAWISRLALFNGYYSEEKEGCVKRIS